MEQKHKLTGAKEKFRFKMIRILIILVDIFLLYSFRVNKKVPPEANFEIVNQQLHQNQSPFFPFKMKRSFLYFV